MLKFHKFRSIIPTCILGLCLTTLLLAKPGEAPLAQGTTLPRVLRLIEQNYVAPDLVDAEAMLHGALDEIERVIPEIIVQIDGKEITMTIDQATRHFTVAPVRRVRDLWKPLQEIFGFIDLNYHGETSHEDLEYLAIDGALGALDPHSNHMRKSEYREFAVGTKGNFGGIGIVIGIRDGHLSVIAPIEGTPASRAGLKAKDRIMQIGDESTINMSLNEAVQRLRGRVGTSVILTVERENRPPFAVTLKRANIRIDSVQSTLLTEGEQSIGYLKAKNFQENTMEDFRSQLAALRKQAGSRFAGLILDLRNNPGGLLQQAVEMANLFLREGVIVSTVGAKGRFLEQESATTADTEPDYPMVILVNEGSASASEIVSGALQAYHRGLVIGSRTFGKGSVQTIYALPDESALKLTIAEYLTAGKNSIQEVGITPDIALLPVTAEKAEMNLMTDRQYTESDLEKHLKKHATKKQHSRYQLRYLRPPEPAQETPEESQETYTAKLDLTDDFAAQFARRLLLARSVVANDSWGQVGLVITQVQTEEAKKLQEALEQLGLTWTKKAPHGEPQLRMTYHLRHQGRTVTRIPVGEEAEMVLTAKNVGTGPYYQLIGQTKTDIPELSNKEFVYGLLNPGAERAWTVSFKAKEHTPSARIPVEVEFHEGNRKTPASFTALVPFEGAARPQFALSYRLGIPIHGEDRPLPIGKSIPLQVEVKNVGHGTSREALLSIKNVDEGKGPFIEVGRVTLPSLAPGNTETALLRFHIDPTFEEDAFSMELTAIDTALVESLSDKLTFSVKTGTIVPAARQWLQGPTIALTQPSPPATTLADSHPVKGAITDDHAVKDFFIFVGNQKVFYQSNSTANPTVPLATTIPLEPGDNIVTVAARDDLDLLSRTVFHIYRAPDQLARQRASE